MATQKYTPIEFIGNLVASHQKEDLSEQSYIRLKVYINDIKTYVDDFSMNSKTIVFNKEDNPIFLDIKDLLDSQYIDAEFDY